MPHSPSLTSAPDVDDWLFLGEDGQLHVRSGKVDIGQRISTALAVIAAEELRLDPTRVVVEPRETDRVPDEGMTSGSNSIQQSGVAVQAAAATARRRLLELAAARLDASPDRLDLADGLVRAEDSNRTVSYQELVGEDGFGIPVDPGAPTIAAEAYRWLGGPSVARSLEAMVSGRLVYLQDMVVDGMLHARVVRPPHANARLIRLDDDVVTRTEESGLRLVVDGSFIAVAGADEFRVLKTAERLSASAEWDSGDGLPVADLWQVLANSPRISLPVVDGKPREEPVPPMPVALTEAELSARYERPYLMHGSIGPSAAMALFEDGRLTIWTHSQGIYPLRGSLAEALDMDETALRLIHVPGPGCYGHNGADDAAFDAALVARETAGRPVLLKWTRDDEHAWEPYGTAMAVEVRASLKDGRIRAWGQASHGDTFRGRPRAGPDQAGPKRLLASRFRAEALPPYEATPNMNDNGGLHRNLEPYYQVGEKHLVKHLVRGLPLRTSALRCLGAAANVFAAESFMDELAELAGEDALAFRLAHLDDERARAVLQSAADGIGWGRQVAEGTGRGLAFARYKNKATYAAVGVELAVDDRARVTLRRAVVAADSGQVIDSDGLAAQLEGGFLQAASWALYEEVGYDSGGITTRDWETYPILRFDNVPDVEIRLMARPGMPPLGAGEAAGGPAIAAIANAIAQATGLRLRRTPFTPNALMAAAAAD